MQVEEPHSEQDDFLAAKQAVWSGFVKWSTRSIVAIALVLIILAIWLL